MSKNISGDKDNQKRENQKQWKGIDEMNKNNQKQMKQMDEQMKLKVIMNKKWTEQESEEEESKWETTMNRNTWWKSAKQLRRVK
jgi:hypothetical protein